MLCESSGNGYVGGTSTTGDDGGRREWGGALQAEGKA